MTLTVHPVEGKEKARIICSAFARGAPAWATGHVFFGVNDSNLKYYTQCIKRGEPWFYVDNSYHDKVRGLYFRVTRNALQHSGLGESDGARFKALNVPIKPWRTTPGREILVCPQSDSFMRTAARYPGDWTKDTLEKLRGFGVDMSTVRVRPWNPDKIKLSLKLMDELNSGAIRLLVTHSSASAITAMLEGVPAISEAGAAHSITGPLTRESVENPPMPADRERLASVLADQQFTLEEMVRGKAWEAAR